jgi:hypothetical protein
MELSRRLKSRAERPRLTARRCSLQKSESMVNTAVVNQVAINYVK